MTQAQPLTDAERQRRHRQDERAGIVCLRVRVHEIDLAEALVAGGLLDPAHDRAALERAVAEQLRLLERLPR